MQRLLNFGEKGGASVMEEVSTLFLFGGLLFGGLLFSGLLGVSRRFFSKAHGAQFIQTLTVLFRSLAELFLWF